MLLLLLLGLLRLSGTVVRWPLPAVMPRPRRCGFCRGIPREISIMLGRLGALRLRLLGLLLVLLLLWKNGVEFGRNLRFGHGGWCFGAPHLELDLGVLWTSGRLSRRRGRHILLLLLLLLFLLPSEILVLLLERPFVLPMRRLWIVSWLCRRAGILDLQVLRRPKWIVFLCGFRLLCMRDTRLRVRLRGHHIAIVGCCRRTGVATAAVDAAI